MSGVSDVVGTTAADIEARVRADILRQVECVSDAKGDTLARCDARGGAWELDRAARNRLRDIIQGVNPQLGEIWDCGDPACWLICEAGHAIGLDGVGTANAAAVQRWARQPTAKRVARNIDEYLRGGVSVGVRKERDERDGSDLKGGAR